MIRVEILASTSSGSRAQSAVMASSTGHRAQHHRVPIGAAVALHPDRADVGQQHHRALPDVAVQPGPGQLLADDGVGLAQDVEPLLVTSPTMRIASPGPGKGWRQTISAGRPSSSPTRRTSSLNSVAQRLDELELRSSGSPPTLWWHLMLAVPVPPPDSTTSG